MMNATSAQPSTQSTSQPSAVFAPVAVSAATPAEQDMSIAAIAHRNRDLFDTLIAAMAHTRVA